MKKIISIAIIALMLISAIIPAGATDTQKPIIGYSESLIEKISDEKISELTDIKNFNISDKKTEYKITDAEGLIKLSALVAALDFEIVKDDDGNITEIKDNTGDNGFDFDNTTVYLVADVDVSASDSGFKPIGNDLEVTGEKIRLDTFKGTFDGQGHTVKLGLNTTTSYGSGLFAGLKDAVVKNLVIEGKVINSKAGTAAVAGWMQTSTITNVWNKADVTSSNRFIGGIVGQVYCYDTERITDGAVNTITNVTNEGNVQGQGQIGGIVGNFADTDITGNIVSKCVNYGDIRGTGAPSTEGTVDKYCGTGGIVGNIYGGGAKVSECYNFGTISATKHMGSGGIVGVINPSKEIKATVENCFNKGVMNQNNLALTGSAYTQDAEKLVGAYATDAEKSANVSVKAPDASYVYDVSLEPAPEEEGGDGEGGNADVPAAPPSLGGSSNTSKDDDDASEDTAPDTTEASETTEAETEADGGCGSSVIGVGMALMAVCACGCAVVSKKRR